MDAIKADKELVSMCGLYCAACPSYAKGKCPGCAKNTKAAWCKIRSCCLENCYSSCADCTVFTDPMACRNFNNIISRLVGLFLNSNRNAGIVMIKERGRGGFAEHMAQYGRVAIRRRG